jgi:hypothetical protein
MPYPTLRRSIIANASRHLVVPGSFSPWELPPGQPAVMRVHTKPCHFFLGKYILFYYRLVQGPSSLKCQRTIN